MLGGGAVVVSAAIWAVAAYLLWTSSWVPSTLHLPHVDTSALFPAAELHRVDAYDRVASLIAVAGILVELAVFVVYARYGAQFARESAAGPVGTGMLLGMLGFGLVWLAELPPTLAELWWDRRHGLETESYAAATFGGWAQLGFKFVTLCLALGLVMGLARLVGRSWWLLAAPVFVGLYALVAFVGPWLATGTHRVGDSALGATVARLERQEHVAHLPVYVQDVLSETSLPNAETEGIGPSKRIVIWNTLLDGRFTAREVRVVIAHELGHARRDHIVKSIAWYALFAFPFAFIISRVVARRGGMGEPAAVPLAILVFVVLELLALPVQNLITRHMEAEADWIALETTRDPKAAAALFATFVPTSLANPSPPTWEYLLFDDHPTIAQRIAMARAWQARYATSASSSGSATQLP